MKSKQLLMYLRPLAILCIVMLFAGCGGGGGGGGSAPTNHLNVASSFPADSASGVTTNTVVSLTFDESIDPDTITTATFSISEGGDPVPGTVRCSGTTATFIPSAPLLYGKTYTALATTGVTDLAGNALASAHSWTFTTPPLNVSANIYHSVALKGDGTLWVWGRNNYGQLGDGTTGDSSFPKQVTVGTTWVSVSAGGYHTVAIRDDGTIWAWGFNNRGQLGKGTIS